jgi:hypothetical protein
MPINHIPEEADDAVLFTGDLKAIRAGNMNNEKECDEHLEIIEHRYRRGQYSDEQVRYATKLILEQT